MFKVKALIIYFFKMKSRVLFQFTSSYINKTFKVIKIFLKKNFKLDLN